VLNKKKIVKGLNYFSAILGEIYQMSALSKLYFEYQYTIKRAQLKEANFSVSILYNLDELRREQIYFEKMPKEYPFSMLWDSESAENWTQTMISLANSNVSNQLQHMINFDKDVIVHSNRDSFPATVSFGPDFGEKTFAYKSTEFNIRRDELFSMLVKKSTGNPSQRVLIFTGFYSDEKVHPVLIFQETKGVFCNLKIKNYRRLPAPFETNCREYEQDGLGHQRLCLLLCQLKVFNEPIPDSLSKFSVKVKQFEYETNGTDEQKMNYCSSKCSKEDCLESLIQAHIEKIKSSGNEPPEIHLRMKSAFDAVTLYAQQPKIDLITYIVGMGSILSFWIGFCVLRSVDGSILFFTQFLSTRQNSLRIFILHKNLRKQTIRKIC